MIWPRAVSNRGVEFRYPLFFQGGTLFLSTSEDKNFKNHFIKPCQTISIIGPTGSGKSTALLDFILNRKTNSFNRIIIFSGSTTDEPLYNLFKKISSDIELIQDADKLPELSEMNGLSKK